MLAVLTYCCVVSLVSVQKNARGYGSTSSNLDNTRAQSAHSLNYF